MELKTLIVRIPLDQPLNQDQKLVRVLTENSDAELPFELPEFFEWPEGPQSISRRGRLLMLAGLKYMQERYPKMTASQTPPAAQPRPSAINGANRDGGWNMPAAAASASAAEATSSIDSSSRGHEPQEPSPREAEARQHQDDERPLNSNGADDDALGDRDRGTYDISLFQ
jgi:hypothetical protein